MDNVVYHIQAYDVYVCVVLPVMNKGLWVMWRVYQAAELLEEADKPWGGQCTVAAVGRSVKAMKTVSSSCSLWHSVKSLQWFTGGHKPRYWNVNVRCCAGSSCVFCVFVYLKFLEQFDDSPQALTCSSNGASPAACFLSFSNSASTSHSWGNKAGQVRDGVWFVAAVVRGK